MTVPKGLASRPFCCLTQGHRQGAHILDRLSERKRLSHSPCMTRSYGLALLKTTLKRLLDRGRSQRTRYVIARLSGWVETGEWATALAVTPRKNYDQRTPVLICSERSSL